MDWWASPMPYLCITGTGAGYFHVWDVDIVPEPNESVYKCDRDLRLLFKVWLHTPEEIDQLDSAVMADYLQDHRELLLDGATGPQPAQRLDALIEWLRSRLIPAGA